MLAESFDYCGITSRNHLHSTLKYILKESEIVHDYIDDQHPSDEIDGFRVDDPVVFEEEISNQEADLINMDTQIEAIESDDDFEDSENEDETDSELEEEDREQDDEEEQQQEENDENHEPVIAIVTASVINTTSTSTASASASATASATASSLAVKATTSANANPTSNQEGKRRKRKEYRKSAYNKLVAAANDQNKPVSITTKKTAANKVSKPTPNAKAKTKTSSKDNSKPVTRKQPSRAVKKSN